MTCVIHSTPVWLPQTQTWMYNQARYLPAEIDCHVVCDRTENLSQFNLPNIHCLWASSRLRYFWDKSLRKLRIRRHLEFLSQQIRSCRADLVHSHFGHIGWHDVPACRKAGVKQVVTFYGLDVNHLPRIQPRWRTRYRELFASVERVLCEGPFMARSIAELGCPEEKLTVQRLGIDLAQVAFRPRRWVEGEPLKILIAASFREKKGIVYALRALGRLGRQLPLEVTVIGDADRSAASQSEKRKIIAAIEDGGLRENVRLLGYQPHSVMLRNAYESHLFLSPSVTAESGDTEGGAPVSIIEMAASGMLVVATFHCDIPQVIEHEKTGLLAPERDVDALVQALQTLIDHPERWLQMQEASRRHVEKSFDARRQGQALGELYRQLTKS